MANASENQASSLFAATFARLLAQVVSAAQGKEWKVTVTDPPPSKLPSIQSPVPYRFRFGEGVKGACYAVLGDADVSVLGGGQQPAAAAKDVDMVADAEALVEDPGKALLALMLKLADALSEALAVSHGPVTAKAEKADRLDALAVYGVALEASDQSGASTVILLHLDPSLIESLAAEIKAAPAPSPENSAVANSMVQANLGLVMDVELSCTLRFGQRQLSLREILDLASGSVVELDRQVDEPVELILDGRVIARGEAVIIDGNYGLRVTQVLHTIAY